MTDSSEQGNMDLVDHIAGDLQMTLASIGFVRQNNAPGVVACFVRRNFSHNRAVVIVECPPEMDPALFARSSRDVCKRAAGFYVPIFYEIGLQIVVLGPAAITEPTSVVDTFSNQTCVLQAVHVVDLSTGIVTSGTTWGQTVTKEIHSAVAVSLRATMGKHELHGERGPTSITEPPVIKSLEQPHWFRNLMLVAAVGAIIVFVIRIILLFTNPR
jgi:hypothetical protein